MSKLMRVHKSQRLLQSLCRTGLGQATRATRGLGTTGGLSTHVTRWRNQQGTSRGTVITDDEITADWDSTQNLTRYKVSCEHFYMNAFITYNTTAYANITSAWDDDGAYILFAIDFDQAGTTWSGWSLISNFLLFQAPDIDPTLNFFIALPIWVAIASLIIIILATILPFV